MNNADIRDFRDLVVWQRAITLAKEIYQLTRRFPADERFGLTNSNTPSGRERMSATLIERVQQSF
jgi:hypothetical protein